MPTDRRPEARSAAWGVLAVVFGAPAVAVWLQVGSEHAASVPLIAFAGALSLVTGAGLVLCFGAVFGWRIPRIPLSGVSKRMHDNPDPPRRGLGQGLGAILASMPPLEMRLEDEEWELWHGWIWIAALKIRLMNRTFDKRTIRLKRFSLDPHLGTYTPPKPNTNQADAVFHETIRRGDSYSSHIKAMDLEPDDSMSGWYVHWVSMSADGGRPPCTFVVTDTAGDTYELPIPARERRSHRMPTPESRLPEEDQ